MIKCSHYVMDYIINPSPIFSLIFYLVYLEHLLCQICIHIVFTVLSSFQYMIIRHYSTGWTVAKLFGDYKIKPAQYDYET